MKKLLLFALLLLPSLLHGAQTFTIPLGTTTYGPFSVNVANRYATVSIERTLWTDPNRKMRAIVYVSSDKAATWVRRCEFTAEGIASGLPPINVSCPFRLPGVTHIQVEVIVTGGAITVPKIPAVGGKT